MDHGVDDFSGAHAADGVVDVFQRKTVGHESGGIETTGAMHADEARNIIGWLAAATVGAGEDFPEMERQGVE